ncbi:hypothetical protein A2U01_0053530 [Trifolium medium]|uniref:Secreted protein n=1 Tax=Trifolium medium TaxID=97028 RepID=A0A392R7W3_9FABA|nr:hypothetical protein [Trifolium medium]
MWRALRSLQDMFLVSACCATWWRALRSLEGIASGLGALRSPVGALRSGQQICSPRVDFLLTF